MNFFIKDALLEFQNDDGSVLNLDVDISPPVIPVSNLDFDGNNRVKRDWLAKIRMQGWLPEWFKSEDMSEAHSDDSNLSLRLRKVFFFINS